MTQLVATADVADYLGIPSTNTTEMAKLPVIIAQAQAAIENRVGGLTSAQYTSRVRGGVRALVLPRTPATQLISVTPVGGVALDISRFYLDTDAGIVNTMALLPYSPVWLMFPYAQYDVTYMAGRTDTLTDPDKADLVLAFYEMVRHLIGPRRGGPIRQPAATQPVLQPRDGRPPVALPPRVQELIEPHRPVAFG